MTAFAAIRAAVDQTVFGVMCDRQATWGAETRDVVGLPPGDAELFGDLSAARMVIEYPAGQFDGLTAGEVMTVDGTDYRVLARPVLTAGNGFMRAELGAAL